MDVMQAYAQAEANTEVPKWRAHFIDGQGQPRRVRLVGPKTKEAAEKAARTAARNWKFVKVELNDQPAGKLSPLPHEAFTSGIIDERNNRRLR